MHSTVLDLLFRFEVPVDDSYTVQMIQAKGQLCQVKFHVFFCKHHLQGTTVVEAQWVAGLPLCQNLTG